ncbi:MAG: DUF1542 domain-containing protein, partial [Firmicutes bacterium]|nr:DUF1542 domain-containing protein [Bacillota bacterium]
IIVLGMALVMLFSFVMFGASSCEVYDPRLTEMQRRIEELEEQNRLLRLSLHQANAIIKLHNHLNALDESEFSVNNWGRIKTYFESGIANIEKAESIGAIDAALTQAKEHINSVYQSLLNAATIEQIKQDGMEYLAQSNPDFSLIPEIFTMENMFFYYYGTFNGNIVIMIRHVAVQGGLNVMTYELLKKEPSGLRFIPSSQSHLYSFRNSFPYCDQFIVFSRPRGRHGHPYVWNNGNFIRLHQAYDKNLLTVNHIEQIATIHHYDLYNISHNREAWH